MNQYIKLGSGFQLVGGGTPATSKEEYWCDGENGFPWISSADIDLRGNIRPRRTVSEIGILESATNIVPAGTVIVVTRVGLGKVAILPSDMCFSQDIQALIPRTVSEYNSRFLLYQISYKMQRLKYWGQGTTISGITKKQLGDVDLFFPPLPEQERIVARIEELFSQLDNGVETLKNLKSEIEAYRYSVIDDSIPFAHLSRIADCITEMGQGWSPKCESTNVLDDDNWAVIKTTAIQPLCFQFQENKKLPAELLPRIKHEISVGDVLITRAGPKSRCGIACMVKKTKQRLLNCDKVYRIRVDKSIILPEYLEYVLNSPRFIQEINLCKTGGNDSGLNLTQDRFLEIKIPVPNLSEQSKIVADIESRLSMCDSIEQTIDSALQQAEALRQSILKRAFEGGL